MNQNRGKLAGDADHFSINYILFSDYTTTYLIEDSRNSKYVVNKKENNAKMVGMVVHKCRWCKSVLPSYVELIKHLNQESNAAIQQWEQVNRRKLPLPYLRIGAGT